MKYSYPKFISYPDFYTLFGQNYPDFYTQDVFYREIIEDLNKWAERKNLVHRIARELDKLTDQHKGN